VIVKTCYNSNDWIHLEDAALEHLHEDKHGSLFPVFKWANMFQAKLDVEFFSDAEAIKDVVVDRRTMSIHLFRHDDVLLSMKYFDRSTPPRVKVLIGSTCYNVNDWIHLKNAALKYIDEQENFYEEKTGYYSTI
jgi:hypothetical protein